MNQEKSYVKAKLLGTYTFIAKRQSNTIKLKPVLTDLEYIVS